MTLHIRPIEPRDLASIRQDLTTHWGSTRIWSLGRRHDADRLPGFVAELDGAFAGSITLHLDAGAWQCEVITLSSRASGHGVGSELLAAAEEFGRDRGCRRMFLTTTNDNWRAFRFYQRRGWRLAALHRGVVDRVRRFVPDYPLLGNDDLPIHDELEFERELLEHGAPGQA